MRTEEEMYRLILEFTKKNEQIRVVGLNGSRVNPNIKPDEFQDFDVVFLVDDLHSFLKDHSWVDYFGERAIMQMPEAMNGIVTDPNLRRFAYLMQFIDGNRIDLSLRLLTDLEDYLGEDSLIQILLDKDGRVPNLPTASEESHVVRPPSADDFYACQNEFWWVATYVAKGLRRGELLYAVKHMHDCVLGELLKMADWVVAIEYDFKINVGHSNKFLARYLPEEGMADIYQLYRLDSVPCCWTALLKSFDLFEDYSKQVEKHFGYPCYKESKKARNYVAGLYQGR